MKNKLLYTLTSGKNNKPWYYTKAYARLLVPQCMTERRGEKLLAELRQRDDYEYCQKRIDYYCQLTENTPVPEEAKTLREMSVPEHESVYFFDSREIARLFPREYRWVLLPDDITYVPDIPSIVKSRPIAEDVRNSVILKLDKIRHFIFMNDTKPWRDKMSKAIFRGKVYGKPSRAEFMRMYYGSDICDCGDVGKHANPEWLSDMKTLREHLDYRYIMALEGYDVASNLKWVMSSNSAAVMPRPTCETWFMEATLIPNYHYIEIKSDFSDLRERLAYYDEHPEEAETIIQHAHEYIDQFRDNRRELLIGAGVMDKYFKMTGQHR